MKKIFIFTLISFAIFSLMSCEEDEKNVIQDSVIVGKWEFDHRTRNGNLVEIAPDEQCIYDQLYEFHVDGTVTSNNPCLQLDRAISKANWRIDGDNLSIDYYVIPYLSVTPLIVRAEKDTLVLQQMWGDNEVIQNVLKRTDKPVADYAADLAGEYTGWMNYSSSVITNTDRGDSMMVDLNLEKMGWSTIDITYKNINVFGLPRTVKTEGIQAHKRANERLFTLDETIGSNMLNLSQDSVFNIRNNGYRSSLNPDSIYLDLNFTRIEKQDPNNEDSPTVENIYQFNRFRGLKKK